MKQGTQPGAEASPAAASTTVLASASMSAPSAKATTRRKKGYQAFGDNERRDEGKSRSTTAVRNGPATLFHTGLGDRLSNLPDSERAAINGALVGVAGDRPPRVSARKPKACVPTLEDALDDVQVRFVLNLPEAELSSADRLFFQLEQAWWFYEDFIADAHKHLPHFKLKEFAKLLFEHCEALRPLSGKYNELFEHFKSWKGTIPTAGCILLNPAMTKVVLVKSWRGNNRGLPKGKINQGEPAIAAAVREVMEETGFDASGSANERDFLTLYLNGQQTTHYIVTGVNEGFAFEPQVRKEISAVEWFPLDALPKGCYGVEPFVPRLRRWMAKTKGMRAPKDATADARTQSLIRVRKGRATSPDMSAAAAAALAAGQASFPAGAEAANCNAPSKKHGRKGGKSAGGKGETGRACSAPSRRNHLKGCDANNRDTFGGGGLDEWNGGNGWDFEAMLAANERLTGRTFVYDGNPHEFGEPARAAASRVSGGAPAAPAEPARGNSREVREGYRKERGGRAQQRQQQSGLEELTGLSIGSEFASFTEKAVSGCETDKNVAEDGQGRNRGKGAAARGVRASTRANATGEAEENASAATYNISRTSKSGVEEGLDGGASSGWGARAGEDKICPRAANSPCIGGTGREGDVPGVATVWGPSSGGSTAGGADLFGEFKFDMMDIMSVVPRV